MEAKSGIPVPSSCEFFFSANLSVDFQMNPMMRSHGSQMMRQVLSVMRQMNLRRHESWVVLIDRFCLVTENVNAQQGILQDFLGN